MKKKKDAKQSISQELIERKIKVGKASNKKSNRKPKSVSKTKDISEQSE